MSKRDSVTSPHSSYKEEIVKKLKSLNYIKDYTVTGEIIKSMNIDLVYEDNQPAFTDIKIYSKPGGRWYVSYKDLKSVVNDYGCSLISTPQGILTNKEAKKQKVGGELLFAVW